MGLREQAAQDAQAILEDSSGFAWPFTLISPTGVAAELRGFTQDIGQSIDPDTGQSVAGRRASVAASLRSLTALRLLPEAVADADKKPWLVTFANILGVPAPWKVIEVLPDRATGVLVLLLEVYHHAPIDGPDGILQLPSLELLGSFAPRVVVLGALTLPSVGLGGEYSSLVVVVASGLELPSLGLAGDFSSLVQLSGGLSLLGLEFAGTLTTVVEVSGPLLLPSLQLAGDVSPNVALSGSLGLFSVELSGAVSPQVTLSGSPIAPSLELAGGLTPVVEVSAPLLLPSLLLAGGVTPSVALIGSLGLPSLLLAGGVTPQVNLSGSPLLPSMGISGGISPAVALSGTPTLPSLQLSGTAFTPIYTFPAVASLVAHWSGNVATTSEVPNRVGGAVGPMVQPTVADRPSIITLTGGVKALRFDGSTDDMFTPDVAALRSSPKAFWAWHLRANASSTGRLFSQWGPSERVDLNYIFNTRFESRIATSPVALAQRNYNTTSVVVNAGIWLTMSYDGTNANPVDRNKFFISGVDTPASGAAGTMPTTLQAGDATELWLCSQGGILNAPFDIAHFYICNDIPSAGEILAMRDFETPNWS